MSNKDIHKSCIQILFAIQTYETWIANLQSGIYRVSLFPEAQAKARHDVDIYQRCIKRLEQRYNKQLNKLKEL